MDLNSTSVFSFEMSFEFFASVNVPFSIVNIVMNAYFIFCMAFPVQGSERLKQPLNVLLGSLFGLHAALHACSLLWALMEVVFFLYSVSNALFFYVVQYLVLFFLRTSVTSSLWLNIFYYSQIVPAQHCFHIWLKKNIKVFIYSALIVDKLFHFFGFITNTANVTLYFAIVSGTNTTQTELSSASDAMSFLVSVNYWIRLGLNIFNLFAMSAASCATILYLWRHIKNMRESNNNFSSSSLKKQMRATITGFVQAVLYFFCSNWMTLDALLRVYLPINYDVYRHILCTFISFYSFGTTINVCVGQSIFRKRIVHLWKNILQKFSE